MKIKLDFSDGLAKPLRAKHSGICPLCSTYVRKGQSLVVRLPEALVPRGDGYRSSDDGGHYHGGSPGPISMQPRWWAHERCAINYMRNERGSR